MYYLNKPILFLITASAFVATKAQQMPAPAGRPKEPAVTAAGSFSEAAAPKKMNPDANLNSKEINVSYDIARNADIIIENSSRNLEIKTWDQPKVKITTTVYFEGDGNNIKDEDWLEKLNIVVKTTASSFKIKSGFASGGSYTLNGVTYPWNWSDGDRTFVFNGTSSSLRSISTSSKSAKKIITIYLPKEGKLDVENKYSDINIASDINKLKLDITNGNADLGNINNLILRSKYANINIGTVKTAEIEFVNGRCSIKSADDLDLDTKYATVDIDVIKKLNFHSTNDEYEFEEVGSLQGSKNYGNLRVTKLTESLDLTGTNADVKIRNIDANVSAIKMDNKYADLRLPLKNLKNYNVEVKGSYNSVYPDKSNSNENVNESGYTAAAGTGKGATISVKCQNCTVDFK